MRKLRNLFLGILLLYAVGATIQALIAFPPLALVLVAIGIWAVRKGRGGSGAVGSDDAHAPAEKANPKTEPTSDLGGTEKRKERPAPSKEQVMQRMASVLRDATDRHHLEYERSGYPDALEGALTLEDYRTYGIPGDLVEITLVNGKKHGACRSFRYGLFGWRATSNGKVVEGRWEPFRKVGQLGYRDDSFSDGTTAFRFYSAKDSRCFLTFQKLRSIMVDRLSEQAAKVCSQRVCASNDRDVNTAIRNYISMLPGSMFTDPDLHELLLKKLCEDDPLLSAHLSPDSSETGTFYHPAYRQALDQALELFKALAEITGSRLGIDGRLAATAAYLLLREELVRSYSRKWLEGYAGNRHPQSLGGYVVDAVDGGLVHSDDSEALACLTYYLIDSGLCRKPDFIEALRKVQETVSAAERERRNRQLTATLLGSGASSGVERITIEDIDLMDGDEFEHALCLLFRKMGYSAYVTKQSGDQGIDVVAERGAVKIGIQAKCYCRPVGNGAVQEAVAGRAFYGCSGSMVVTNSTFTKSAVELAQISGVDLWDRTVLEKKLADYPISR